MYIPTESEVKAQLKAAGFHPRKAKDGRGFTVKFTEANEPKLRAIAEPLGPTGGWYFGADLCDMKMDFYRTNTRRHIVFAEAGWKGRIAATNCRSSFGSAL